jgi:prevent-host-death family protein
MRIAIDISKDIHSLTDFKRKTTELVGQLKTTGRPLVLTVNGKAELVVQDVASYQQVLDVMERVEAVEAVRRGLDQMYRGKGRPVAQFSKRMRRKYGMPR